MKNKEISKLLYQIADLLEIEEQDFKPFVYRKAAFSVSKMEEDIEDVYKKEGKKGLIKIEGVGKNIADRIEEYLLEGKIDYLNRLKEKFPIDFHSLLEIEGLGHRKIKILFQELEIKNLEDLKREIKKGRVSSLPGFGEKTAKKLMEGISFLEEGSSKRSLGEIIPIAQEIYDYLKEMKEVEMIDMAGSFRRRKELVGDLDILISSPLPKKVMKKFVSFKEVAKVILEGETKSSIRIKEGFDIDLRVVEKSSFGAALQYFTGSKEHNIALRKISLKKGYKLNEYGLFKGKKKIAGEKEEDIYRLLGISFIPPELREDRGEVEEALKGEDFSFLLDYGDIKGDLHVHSDWNGGINSISEIVKEAEKMGYNYIGIADHTKFLRIENGLDEKDLREQRKEIEKIKSKVKILQGCEANILKDGKLDIGDKDLKELDYVIAGVHSSFRQEREVMTERVIKAMKNPQVNIISHPTGRLLKRREGLNLDLDKIIRAAREFGVILEINSSPARLDLDDINIRRCIREGVPLIINSDAHHIGELYQIKMGVNQARRGWAGKKEIINTYPIKKLLKQFQK